ncbi:MAG: DUF4097 family beta strand repeat-containing protein [Myxococcota bacterium]
MRVAMLALWVALLLPAPLRADEFDERIEVEPGGLLEVDLDLGDGLRPDPGSLEVTSHDRHEVRVRAEASGWGAGGVGFRLERQGDTVRFDTWVGGALSWMFGGPSVRVRIWVPREYSVDLRCSAGPIHIEDVGGAVRARTTDAPIEVVAAEGPVSLRTANGDVRVTEILGDVRVKASTGSIEVSWISGDVEVRTGAGQIEASHIDGELALRTDRGGIEVRDAASSVEARTERGSVFVSFLGEPAGLLETRRGSVEVQMPEHAGAELDAVTRGGEIELANGLEPPGGHPRDRVVGPINGGGPLLRLYTARGSIRVSRR